MALLCLTACLATGCAKKAVVSPKQANSSTAQTSSSATTGGDQSSHGGCSNGSGSGH